MKEKRVLIAMDTSENSAKAVRYVARMVSDSPGFFVELLSVHRVPDRHIFVDEQEREQQDAQEKQSIREALDRASRTLRDGGLSKDSVSVLSFELQEGSIAEAVLDHQRRGGFGTVVVGRRGVSKSEEALFGSVSKRVVTHAKDCTVWVVE